jgi:hypothetical protein
VAAISRDGREGGEVEKSFAVVFFTPFARHESFLEYTTTVFQRAVTFYVYPVD